MEIETQRDPNTAFVAELDQTSNFDQQIRYYSSLATSLHENAVSQEDLLKVEEYLNSVRLFAFNLTLLPH
jgi:hypothetical protein